MKRFFAVTALAGSLALSSAWAADISFHPKTAGELADLCGANPKETAGIAKINYCHGFAQGAVDVERKHAEESKMFCFPPSPPNREVVLTEFVNWARALPDHRSQPALTGLFHFLGERFPCK
jgi:hypothetical protein